MRKLIFILLLFISINTFAQNEISGTVTYYFNKYQGDKVDIGSKVYLIDSVTYSNAKGLKYLKGFSPIETRRKLLNYYTNDLTRLNNDSKYNKLLERRKKLEKRNKHLKKKNKVEYSNILNQIKLHEEKIKKKKEDVAYYTDSLKKDNAYEDENWKTYQSNASSAFRELSYSSENKIKTVNGTGTYSFKNVANGKYYIIIQSNNRTAINSLEILGKVFVKHITINGQDLDVSHKFNI